MTSIQLPTSVATRGMLYVHICIVYDQAGLMPSCASMAIGCDSRSSTRWTYPTCDSPIGWLNAAAPANISLMVVSSVTWIQLLASVATRGMLYIRIHIELE